MPAFRTWLHRCMCVAAILIATGHSAAQVSTSLALSSSDNPSILGQNITLTATVSPSTVTGKVTFYDGTSVLGTSALANGQAALQTSLLASGTRSLKALYLGNLTGTPSVGKLTETVNSLPERGAGFAVPYNGFGGNPQAVAIGDFNGDGKTDLAVADFFGGVYVSLNLGAGIFQTPVSYAAGSGPGAVAAGDYNGDGKTDLAVTNFNDNTVSVLLGNGDGTFQAPVNYATGTEPQSVAVGDFNGDGIADLSVADGNGLGILLGNGDGTFQAAVHYAAGTEPQSVAVGDFNGDGIADLAVANYGSSNLSVFIGAGNGTFANAVNYATGSGPKSVTVGDLDGDGHADLVTANYLSNNVSVVLGKGDGTFPDTAVYATGSSPESVAVGDFNGDGIPDLAVADNNVQNGSNGNAVSILLGAGNGTFAVPVNYGTSTNPVALAAADFKGDGLADLAVVVQNTGINILAGLPRAGTTPASASIASSSNPSIYGQGVTLMATVTPLAATGIVTFYDGAALLGTGILTNGAANLTTSLLSSGAHSLTAFYGGDTTYAAARTLVALTQTVSAVAQNGFGMGSTFSAGRNPQSVVVADFNKDSKLDVATANVVSVSVFLGIGNGTLGNAVDYTIGAAAVATGDFNSDGKPDLVVTTVESGSSVLLGNGDGTFQSALNFSTGGRSVVVGDFNGDGYADLAFINTGVSILLGNGDGTFAAPINYAAPNAPVAVFIGDFNGDGKPDLAVAFNNGNTNGGVSIYLGNGDGTFQAAVNFATPAPALAIAVGDFNGDGKADLAVTNSASLSTTGAVAVLLGNGNGTFQTAVNYAVSGIPESVIAGDFNGDGKLDLAVGCQTTTGGQATPNVAILAGNGNGTFQTPLTYVTGNYPISIAAGDFNGDGRGDLVSANFYDGTVTILLGLAPSTVTLLSSGSPAVYSQPITLTATVSSPGATGLVTFYEGATILGTSTLTGGQAVLTTDMLPPGTGLLRAVYEGNVIYAVSTSASLPQTVTDVPSNGLIEAGAITGFSMPQAVVAGDFNGDGIVDLAVADYAGNSISVLLGIGNGTFQPAVTSAAGTNPYALAVGDFNGDGKADLVSVGGSTLLLLGNGDGTFQTPQTISGATFSSVAVGDFNGDGKADIVFGGSGGVGVLLGNGEGTFRIAAGIADSALSVAVSDFNGDGKVNLVFGVSDISSVGVSFGNGDGTFQAVAFYPTAAPTQSVAVGDFNGDGKLDLVVTNGSGNNLGVLLNNGNGTFAGPVSYGTGQYPISVAVGDFNGDGKADLAAANNTDGTVSILTGNGTGTFQPVVNYAIGNGPTSVATADFNRDGRADLAVTNTYDNDLSILLGAPVSALITTATELKASSTQINFGDQETLTARVSPSSATGTITFLDGTASLGTFSLNNGVATLALTTLTAGLHSLSASYSGDAKDTSSVSPVVTVTVSQAATTTKLTSSANPSTPGQNVTLTATVNPSTATGSMTFSDGLTSLGTVPLSGGTATFSVSTLPSGTNTLFAAYGGDTNDTSSTGKLVQTVGQPTTTTTSLSASANPSTYGQSLTLTATVTSQTSTGMVTFYDGTTVLGAGTLANGSAILKTSLLASGARSLKAYYGGDFSHLASLSPKLTLTVNTVPSSGFHGAPALAAGAVPYTVVAGDFNGDGNIDLAVTDQGGLNQTSAGINVFLGNGDGTFGNALNVSTGPSPVFLVTGDFNGDGKTDLAYGSYTTGQVNGRLNILLGNGGGTFQAGASYQVSGSGSPFIVAGDFNEDGYTDLAALADGEVQLFFGNGNGTFRVGITYGIGSGIGATSAVVGDFNGDGHADFALATNNGSVAILSGNGDGTFRLPPVFYTISTNPIALVYVSVGDFDGDGIADLAVASYYLNGSQPGNVYVLLGHTGGTFQTPVGYPVDILPQWAATGDFNGDGKTDIATANDPTNGDVSVLLGNGDGTFQTAANYAAGGTSQSIATADFNRDGRIDFAVANSGSNNVTVLLGGTVAAQTISFGPLPNVALSTLPFTINATASSGLSVSLASNTTGVCTVSGATVTLIAAGTCSITASQAGNASYSAALPVTQTFRVTPVPTPPTADSVSPASGAGTSQVFTFKYSSANGFGYLSSVYSLINGPINAGGGCYIYYLPASNALYLYNDAGTAATGPLTPGSGSKLSNSQCTLNGAGSSASGAGNTLTVALSISFQAAFARLQNVYGYAIDSAGSGSGWQALGTWNSSGLSMLPPTADSVSPASGAGTSQVFTFKYSSANGFGYLSSVYSLINGPINAGGGCYIYYLPASNALYLYNDAGTAATGPLTPGSGSKLSNSQCTLNGAGSSASGAGNTLTVALSISFQAAFARLQNVYGYAIDSAGSGSGWQALGTWNSSGLSMLPPTADSVSPASGAGTSQVFTFKYSSANGFGYLSSVYSLINGPINAGGGCYIYYLPASNALYLYNDAGTAATGPLTPGSGSKLSNSQCTLNGAGSSASGAGNTLTVALSISFQAAFARLQNVYGYAIDSAGSGSGWQALGTWNSSGLSMLPPTADSVSPASGAGTSQVFTFKYSSANGFGYLSSVYSLINGPINAGGGCYIYYLPASNALYLYNDAGTAATGPLTPGSGSKLSNSQCTLNGAGSSASGAGNTLTVALSISFQAAFARLQNVYGYAIDSAGSGSGWQALGTWNSSGLSMLPPTADSVSPASGAGTSQVFTFKYSSANGFGYLSSVYSLINGPINAGGGCYIYYLPASNALYLYNDAGTAATGPLTPGSGSKLSNSQCTLNGAGSSASGAGNTLTVALSISFQAAFARLQNVYGYAIDSAGSGSGWQALGTWNSTAP